MRRLEWDHLAFVKIVLILFTVALMDRNSSAGHLNISKKRSKTRTNLSENHEDQKRNVASFLITPQTLRVLVLLTVH